MPTRTTTKENHVHTLTKALAAVGAAAALTLGAALPAQAAPPADGADPKKPKLNFGWYTEEDDTAPTVTDEGDYLFVADGVRATGIRVGSDFPLSELEPIEYEAVGSDYALNRFHVRLVVDLPGTVLVGDGCSDWRNDYLSLSVVADEVNEPVTLASRVYVHAPGCTMPWGTPVHGKTYPLTQVLTAVSAASSGEEATVTSIGFHLDSGGQAGTTVTVDPGNLHKVAVHGSR
ncbi:hypothetical protein [Agromyces sp. SYSU T00194]|uniref:hypothetical protein n=1 Tax=Agromyces chitinivorans TaxID=3158560 RepID=UPI003395CDEA